MNDLTDRPAHPPWCAGTHNGDRHQSRPWMVTGDGSIRLHISQAPMFDARPMVILTARETLTLHIVTLTPDQAGAVNAALTSALLALVAPGSAS